MKKLFNTILTAAVLFTAFTAAGCSNALVSKNTADAEETEVKTELSAAIADGKDVSTIFEISSVKLNGASTGTQDFKDSDFSKIVVTFSLNVTDDVLSGITVYPIDFSAITDSASTDIYKRKAALTIVNSVVKGNTATLYADLNSCDAIEIYFDAANTVALNGQKLDTDNDYAQGEGDDDYFVYFYDSNYAGTTYGEERELPSSELISVTDKGVDFTNKKWSFDIDAFGEDAKTLFNGHIVLQNAETDGTWTDVTTTAYYDVNTGSYELIWTSANTKNSLYRVVCKNASSVVTASEYDGYKRKYTLDARNIFEVISTVEYYSGIENEASDKDFFSTFDLTWNDAGTSVKSMTVTINTSNTSYSSDKGYTGEVCGVSGLKDLSKIKLIQADGTVVAWPEFTVKESDAVTYGVNGDKEFYSTYKFTFTTPIAIRQFAVYADPELAIQFQENDGASDISVASYVMAYDSSEAGNKLTKGYVLLADCFVFEWNNTSNGSYCFNQAGTVWTSNNQNQNSTTATSTWTINLGSAKTVNIPWTVSSESGYDKLTITLDGTTKVNAVSGTNSGTITETLSAGTHTLVATYSKDGSESKKDDCATITLNNVY